MWTLSGFVTRSTTTSPPSASRIRNRHEFVEVRRAWGVTSEPRDAQWNLKQTLASYGLRCQHRLPDRQDLIDGPSSTLERMRHAAGSRTFSTSHVRIFSFFIRDAATRTITETRCCAGARPADVAEEGGRDLLHRTRRSIYGDSRRAIQVPLSLAALEAAGTRALVQVA